MVQQVNENERERGQILVLFAAMLVLIMLFTAIVVDLGMLSNDRQRLVNTMDAAALAGGSQMPVTGSAQANAAQAVMLHTINANYPGLTGYAISYRCLIGVTATSPPQPNIVRDIPTVCDPHFSLGHAPVASDFKGAGLTRVSTCNPFVGDKCNAVVVGGSATTPFAFGPAVGIMSGDTGAVQSAACNGPCGAPPSVPVDLIVIIDRTASMSAADVTATRDAAKAVLTAYDPNVQRVGLGLLGPSVTTSTCAGSPTLVYGNAMTSSTGYGTSTTTDLTKWIPVGLSGAGATAPGFNELYKNANGTLNTNSHLVRAINCFNNPGGTGTNLAVPMRMARYYLQTYGRPGVKKGIILETDGQPNYGVGNAADYTCLQSNTDATAAKTAGIEVYTIGFGLDGANNVNCPDSSGAFNGKKVTYLLASMATQTPIPTLDNLCTPAENTDGDHFFCQPKSADLTAIFSTVANQFAGIGAHLVSLYPYPIVNSVSPASGTKLGGNSVTITGQFFSGATKVSFGGALASFTVASDTSITATVPAGSANLQVNVTVTTPGGTSPIVVGDRYTYGP